jgi:hypothetical protein
MTRPQSITRINRHTGLTDSFTSSQLEPGFHLLEISIYPSTQTIAHRLLAPRLINMKSLLTTCYSRAILLVAPLAVYLSTVAVVQAGGKDPLFPGAVRPGLDYRTESSQGYLTVYSATDQFDDGGVLYYAHSSYSIYTTDGKFFKNVENHISRSDEIPEVVTLPAGAYTLEVRSEKEGYLRVHVVINAGVRTVLDLDGEQADMGKRLARAKHSRRLADDRASRAKRFLE